MNITKLKNGYRVRETKNGKAYSINLDHRPTQKEARELLDDLQKVDPILADRHGMTFCEAYEGFCSAKASILSPSTLKGYRTAFRGLPAWFTQMELARIDRTHVQKVVNDFSRDHSPKTVKNQYGLVSAILHFYDCRECPVTLPQAQREDVYIPSEQDVARLLQVASGTKYEVALRLGIHGLRRSEIMALTLDDLSEDNWLTINKALVEGVGGKVLKTTKTTKSTRTIQIDPDLADLIRQQGFIYDGSGTRLSMIITSFEEAAGLPHFSFHKLRHFYASYMHSMGVPDQDILDGGGWETDKVMKSVYRHSLDHEQKQKEMAALISKIQPDDKIVPIRKHG